LFAAATIRHEDISYDERAKREWFNFVPVESEAMPGSKDLKRRGRPPTYMVRRNIEQTVVLLEECDAPRIRHSDEHQAIVTQQLEETGEETVKTVHVLHDLEQKDCVKRLNKVSGAQILLKREIFLAAQRLDRLVTVFQRRDARSWNIDVHDLVKEEAEPCAHVQYALCAKIYRGQFPNRSFEFPFVARVF
jgi:hypothetical protein